MNYSWTWKKQIRRDCQKAKAMVYSDGQEHDMHAVLSAFWVAAALSGLGAAAAREADMGPGSCRAVGWQEHKHAGTKVTTSYPSRIPRDQTAKAPCLQVKNQVQKRPAHEGLEAQHQPMHHSRKEKLFTNNGSSKSEQKMRTMKKEPVHVSVISLAPHQSDP